MLKRIKTITSLIILVCFFLPISQCSMETMSGTETVENIVLSDIVFNNDPDVGFAIILMASFLMPLFFSLIPKLKRINEIFKVIIQFVCSVWLMYLSYNYVFTLRNPLPAGWLLNIAVVIFLILTIIEGIKIKNMTSRLKIDGENTTL